MGNKHSGSQIPLKVKRNKSLNLNKQKSIKVNQILTSCLSPSQNFIFFGEAGNQQDRTCLVFAIQKDSSKLIGNFYAKINKKKMFIYFESTKNYFLLNENLDLILIFKKIRNQ